MRIVWTTLIGLALLPTAAFAQQAATRPAAQDGLEIRVADGKVTMSAQAVPLGRLLALWDRTMGQKSEVLKPELANRNISVRFTNLEIKDAVHKIFEGQPLNYFLIEGKGIRVTDSANGGTASTAPSPSPAPFQDSQPVIRDAPILQQGNAPNPQNLPPNAVQTAPAAFGNQPNPAAAPAANTNTGITPGQLPPAIGTSNPLNNPPAAAPAPAAGFGAPPAQAQPSGPGAVTVTPGALPPR